MINAFQQLYKNRVSIEKIQTEEEVRKVIASELKDEFAHPRARMSLEKKLELALSRIQGSSLSEEERNTLINVYNDEYAKLSTALDV